jgi:hypothetical protein
LYFTTSKINDMSDLFTESEQPTNELSLLVKSSGLAPEKQNEIGQTLNRFFEKATEWTAKVDTIKVTDPTDTITMSMAREGRLGLRSMRLEAEKLVKEKRDHVKSLMADFQLEDNLWLKSGQMMVLQFKHLEDKLEMQEKFAERYAAQQRERLKAERLAILAPLGITAGDGLDTMAEARFKAIVMGLKAQIQAEKDEAERLEAERLAKIQRDKEDRERIEAENARLKAERYAIELKAKQEREKAEVERIERERVIAKEKAETEAVARVERERINAERAESEAKLKAERDRIAELERIAKAKEDAELEAIRKSEFIRVENEKAAKLAAAKAAKAPKKDKLTAWIDVLVLSAPTEFADDLIVSAIVAKFDGFKSWAKSQIETI